MEGGVEYLIGRRSRVDSLEEAGQAIYYYDCGEYVCSLQGEQLIKNDCSTIVDIG